MTSNLVINFVPVELETDHLEIHIAEATDDDPQGTWKSIFVDEDTEDKIRWELTPFSGSQPLLVSKNRHGAVKRIISSHLSRYLQEQGFIVDHDFVGALNVLVESPESRHSETRIYKRFSIKVLSPKDQYICPHNLWCLNVSYTGQEEATKEPLNRFPQYDALIKHVIVGNEVRRLLSLSANERVANTTFPLVGRKLAQALGVPPLIYRVPNKYLVQYNESTDFYRRHLSGVSIENVFTIFESGFHPIPDSQTFSTSKNSNLLVFGNNQTNFSPYNGLKEYGPCRPVQNQSYKFIFVFHAEDRDFANKLYANLTKGLRGYPGLQRFAGLDLKLDKDRSITFTGEDPVPEVKAKLEQLQFETGTNYLAMYISRVPKDDPDEHKLNYYYRLKRLLLEYNITSQVVYKWNIEKEGFNYHLPNISIAILAKLGGIPWRLSRPVKDDLVIGIGAFRQGRNIFLGTTVAFRNDGSFLRFDSDRANNPSDLGRYFQNVISEIAREHSNIKRVVIHFYKRMSHREEKVISKVLEKIGLKIPYVVLNIVEDRDGSFVPFDLGYPGKMPVSGTCITVRKGTYLLCNNTRYATATGQKIDDFPFPVHIEVSRSSMSDLTHEEIQDLVDQAYQFSRMYWVSVKQRGRPVTVEYSTRVAKFSAAVPDDPIPASDTARKSLWFL